MGPYIGYGARVIVRPDNPQPSFSARRISNQLVIKNTGNTALLITSCLQKQGKENREIPLPAYTLYVGQTLTKALAFAAPVTLNAAFMGKNLGPYVVP